ncbi:acyl CoA binding protein-domain-containing protein [Blakeslea trispora]|nr:acyl CoA binding protein-domain-containing protein [Blakeslea trispora]
MANIPPHYTDQYISQRYNKALHFVQNLPASSSFQPTKSQKLELYALYKQVSTGDINTQRPGLFDVVGRAKWDAWKKLEGMSVLEARHTYVEALLRIATEAYKKNMGRAEAQQIIHAFSNMKPSDTQDVDDASHHENISVASEEAEEQAYLQDIQQNAPSTISDKQPQQLRRPGSVASIQTAVTAPIIPYHNQLPSTSVHQVRETPSQKQRIAERRPLQATVIREDARTTPLGKRVFQEQDYVDASVNPWQHIPPFSIRNRQTMGDDNNSYSSSNNSSDENNHSHTRRARTPQSTSRLARTRSMYTRIASPSRSNVTYHPQRFQSPVFGSSTSSSVTTTPHNFQDHVKSRLAYQNTLELDQASSHLALSHSTKRAIEDLQHQLVILNERVDELRQELVEQDRQRIALGRQAAKSSLSSSPSTDDTNGNSWSWVIKAALRYAGVNLMTLFILFLALYKSGTLIAHITGLRNFKAFVELNHLDLRRLGWPIRVFA